MHCELSGWYMRHFCGYVAFDPEYDPRAPETFVEDASWLGLENHFFDGFVSLQPLNLPNYYFHRVDKDDGRAMISAFEDSEEFRRRASFQIVDFSIERTSAYVCLS